jgi:hypothetical protein
VPVRFYNVPATACNVPELEVRQTGTGADQETTFLTGVTIPALPTTSVQLPRAREIKVNNDVSASTTLFGAATKFRFVDAFLDVNGALSSTTTFSTAFLNFVNLAHRVDPLNVNTAKNQFTVVVSKSNTITSTTLKDVVHFQQNVPTATFLSQWIEVAADSAYTLFVFDQGVTAAQIFGDIGATTPVPVPATLPTILAQGTTATLNANDLRVFRIANGAATTDALVVNNVPFGTDTAFNTLVPQDNTRFIVWNNLVHNNVAGFTAGQTLANPDSTCCNFVTDATETDNVFSHPPGGDPDTNTLTPAFRNGDATFKVFAAATGKNCFEIGSPITGATVSFSDEAAGNTCAVKGGFLFGRVVNVQSTVCTFTATGSTCPATAGTLGAAIPVVVGLNGGNNDASAASTVAVFANVPLCDCALPPTTCSLPTCEEQRTQLAQIGAISGQIAASTAAVTAAVTASQNSLAVVLADTNADVGNTNATLLAAINARTSSLASGITRIEGDVEDVLDDLSGVADDIDDLGDDVDDAFDDLQDAVEDLE